MPPATHDADTSSGITDVGPWVAEDPPRHHYDEFVRTSQYVATSDGTRLATDLYLPRPATPDVRFPTILILTPYFRALELAEPGPGPAALAGIEFDSGLWGPQLSRYGFAVLVVEARGAAASFGTRVLRADSGAPRDDVDIVDWVIAQPWSNGLVGATGISAPGMAALHLATAKHPAVRAVAPLWTAFDVFAATHPGGTTIAAFVSSIGDAMRAIDFNDMHAAFPDAPPEVVGLIRGVRPVDEDIDRTLLAAALKEHEGNVYLDRDILSVTFRDEQLPQGAEDTSLGGVSPAAAFTDLQASGAAVFTYAGWYDGAFCADMVTLYRNVQTPGSRLLIGPWGHGGHFYDSPLATTGRPSDFDHAAELARFFDEHLRPDAAPRPAEPGVRYFTLGAEEWRAAATWPPPSEPLVLRLGASNGLVAGAAGEVSSHAAADSFVVDFDHGTGPMSRFSRSTMPVAYTDRAAVDERLLTYTSAPLDADLDVTGHPLLRVHVSADVDDFLLIAYLEDVAPDGSVHVVTEGMQRALFRRTSAEPPPYGVIGPYRAYTRDEAAPLAPGEVDVVDFALFPVSWLFRRGHAIRVALAGADKDNFPRLPAEGDVRITVHRGPALPSALTLPVVG